jgi:hypothetical protein
MIEYPLRDLKKEDFDMSELRRGTKLLLAVALCVSMITSMLVFVPHEAGAASQDGWIEGTVSDGVNPIQNAILIYILNMGGGGNPLGSGSTDSFGHYNLTVAGGLNYMVLAFEGDYYSNSTTVSVVSGSTAFADINLTSISPAVADVTLRGFVKNETGDPVTVGAILGYTNDPLMTEGGPPYYGNTTSPDGLGEYSVNVINGSAGGGVGIMGVPGYGFIDNSTSSPFVSGMTYWLNITLALSISTDDAVIRGNVTDFRTGLPLENVMVNIQSSNAWNMNRSYSNYTFTDSLGHYRMNVTNGTSEIMFSKIGYAIFRLSQLIVNPGANIRINASLLPTNATVSGNVTDELSAPIANAQVFVFDQTGNNISYATTNSLGKFSFDVFVGDNLRFGAQANGYGSNWSYINISDGDSISRDFVLVSFDAWMKGNVTDGLTGNPIAGAGVWIHSAVYDDYTNTNSTGDYNVSLLSGVTYTVDVSAPGYRQNSSQITLVPGGNTHNIALVPDVLPQTTRVIGWVNDSATLTGIRGATVSFGLPPPEYGERNQTTTDASGYFEMWIPPVEMMYVANASNYAHSDGVLDATGQTDMKLMILLDPDLWSPNVTFSQLPTQNISWTNPSAVHVDIQEQDPELFSLLTAIYDHTVGTQAYYNLVQMPTIYFDPLNSQGNGMPYSKVGDVYTIDYQWTGTATGGWLTNTSGPTYYGSYQISMGPTTYDALRGFYSNSSMPGTWMSGTAWFERSTGNFVWFQYDTQIPWADASDTSGLFEPGVSTIIVDVTNGFWSWQSGSMGSSSVVGLTFTYDEKLPSGPCVSLFRARDFAGHEWWTPKVTNLTVDNDIPVASAGNDQLVAGGQEVFFDGSLSSDSSGIANWTWTFTYGGTDYVLWGEYPSFTFSSGDEVVTVTLIVTDGAGHTSTDTMQVTVAGVIPEFPTMLLPVMGILALFAVVGVRRRFGEG